MSATTVCKNLVLTNLGWRAWLMPPRPRHDGSIPSRRAQLPSARFLRVREAGCRWSAALTVEDHVGDRYLAIYHFTHDDRAGWQETGSFLGLDRGLAGKPDPFLTLSAFCTEGLFFAGGRLHDDAGTVTRVEFAWDDGQTLTDMVENGVVLFLGHRDELDPATASFYGFDGALLGRQRALIDEAP